MDERLSIPRVDLAPYTARERAWIALADLFVDTEITQITVDYIARELNQQGFDTGSAQEILFNEVAPVFGRNAHSVGGNWTGWKEGDVVQQVHAWIAKRDSATWAGRLHRSVLAHWARHRFFISPVLADWRRVAQQMRGSQSTPSA